MDRIDDALAELGWLDMLATEPDDAIAIVFETLGALNATASVLDDVVVTGLGLLPSPTLAAALPAFGTWVAPGPAALATARVTTATEIVAGGHPVPIARATSAPLGGIDPTMKLFTVSIETTEILESWDDAVALGRRAIAHQIAGATRAMLDFARTHALERVQFGRPVARFQAVRHKLAESLVAIEALDATLGAAAAEPGPLTAALAKAVAGQTARTVGTHCQQVLAGIGFTTDHAFHTYLRRTMLLDGLFGAADDVVVAIGHELLAGGSVPTLIEL
ncbi:MAG TPA: acyl-CoA dehydrogenase family protein [Acidimicrobiia bacterium]|nr:acyl-CoA dehydrogenase family protein [Acidimicrobiia bacterium]